MTLQSDLRREQAEALELALLRPDVPELVEFAALMGMAADRVDALEAAGRAVVDRWDTPLWKGVPATAEYINALRAALSPAQRGEGE